MMREELTDRIMEALRAIKGEAFHETSELITSGYISSFDLIKLVSRLEKDLEIVIPLEKISADSFNSVEDICDLVDEIRG